MAQTLPLTKNSSCELFVIYIYISFFYTRVHGMAQYFQYFQGQFPQHENSQLHMWRVTNPNIVLLLLATLIQ